MTELTVNAVEYVSNIAVELPYGAQGVVRGNTQILLTAPEGAIVLETASAPYSVFTVIATERPVSSLGSEVQAAIATLTAAVTTWTQEDRAAAAAEGETHE